MTGWLESGLEGRDIKATFRLYLTSLLVLAIMACAATLVIGSQLSFRSTPLFAAILVTGEYVLIRKSALDRVFAVGVFLLVLPLFCLIALLLKLENSHAPAFLRYTRYNQKGKQILLYRFRTFKVEQSTSRSMWLFQFLKQTELQLLPELINVIRGDVALIGPKPLTLEETERHTRELHDKPGWVRESDLVGVLTHDVPGAAHAVRVRLELARLLLSRKGRNLLFAHDDYEPSV